LGLSDGVIGLLRGVNCDIVAQGLIGLNRILIPPRYTIFFGNSAIKKYEVKCAWLREILGWVTVGVIYLEYHGPPVTAQNFGYDRSPPAAND
jgi:hypothetical protein